MSLFGTFLRPKKLAATPKVARCHSPRSKAKSLHVSAAAQDLSPKRRNYGNNTSNRAARRWLRGNNTQSFEDSFVAALVQASACKTCPHPFRPTSPVSRTQLLANQQHRQYTAITSSQRRTLHSKPNNQQANAAAAPKQPEPETTQPGEIPKLGAPLERGAYENLGIMYHGKGGFNVKAPKKPRGPPLNHLPLAPRLVLTPEQELRPPFAPRRVHPPKDEEHAQKLAELKALLSQGPESRTVRRQAWAAYQSLPAPRPRYIRDFDMRKLLGFLSWVEFKSLETSQLFFSVLDECLEEGVVLKAQDWNTAIAFAGRYVKHTSKAEVKSAVETWMRMENEGVIATNVTFNILFDVSVRAGRFALADMIYVELRARNLPLNRYFRTSMIHYAGIRRDGDAVRRAFREFVNAGEIVDTAVMNCVMLSFIRAGEAASADNVFEKMKTLHITKFGAQGPRTWEGRRTLGKKLDQTALELRKERESHEASFFGSLYSTEAKKEEAQRAAPIHPDRRSCEILIRHYTSRGADLPRVKELLGEIRSGGWHVHGSVYSNIFRGFVTHGGHTHPDWNRQNLQLFWEDFLEAVRRPPPPEAFDMDAREQMIEEPDDAADEDPFDIANEDLAPYFTPRLAISVLNAFYKCDGPEAMREAWKQTQDKWREMTDNEKATVQEVVDQLSLEDAMYVL